MMNRAPEHDDMITSGKDPLEAYLAGAATAVETDAVDAWLAAVPDAQRIVSGFVAGVTGQHPGLAVPSARTLLEGIHQQQRCPRSDAVAPARRQRHYYIKSAGALAAGVALLVGEAFLWPHLRSPGSLPAFNQYETARAHHATITLPDGTPVLLAPDTRLRYSAQADGTHTVDLDGQAYFTVTHRDRRPFVVRTRTTTTRVLGTSFAVRSYATDKATQVAVTEGKVEVATTARSVVVLPGEVAHADSASSLAVTHDAKFADVLAWMRKQIVFDDTPLPDVLAELERVYDVDMTVQHPELLARRFSGSFTGDDIATVLDALSFTIGATYRWHGKTVVLSLPRLRTSPSPQDSER